MQKKQEKKSADRNPEQLFYLNPLLRAAEGTSAKSVYTTGTRNTGSFIGWARWNIWNVARISIQAVSDSRYGSPSGVVRL